MLFWTALAGGLLTSHARLNLYSYNINEIKQSHTSGDTFCSSPVSKERVVFPDSLAGRAPMDFASYSGYVNVTSQDWLFYWFFESADGNPNAPLVCYIDRYRYIFFLKIIFLWIYRLFGQMVVLVALQWKVLLLKMVL